MPVEEERASSSSDDSEESDSGSDSEDSSSDSPSPPSLPAPELPSQEDSKRWNRLKNFMLPTAHGNSTPTPQTPQVIFFNMFFIPPPAPGRRSQPYRFTSFSFQIGILKKV